MDLLDGFRFISRFLLASRECSAASHALLYSILVTAVAISLGGIYVWRRFIRNQPTMKMELK